jgi:hypothetical protein
MRREERALCEPWSFACTSSCRSEKSAVNAECEERALPFSETSALHAAGGACAV